jgi:hypothetical protein
MILPQPIERGEQLWMVYSAPALGGLVVEGTVETTGIHQLVVAA